MCPRPVSASLVPSTKNWQIRAGRQESPPGSFLWTFDVGTSLLYMENVCSSIPIRQIKAHSALAPP